MQKIARGAQKCSPAEPSINLVLPCSVSPRAEGENVVIWVHVRTNSLQNGNSESSIGIQASWVTFRKLG